MTLKNTDRFFAITLEHYACPAFCSFNKEYIGTLAMLDGFIDTISKDVKEPSYLAGIINGYQRYRDGYHDATAFVAQSEVRLIHPLTTIEVHHHDAAPFFYEHTNVWGFPYFIRAERMNADIVYVRRGKNHMRYVGAYLEQPLYGTTENDCNDELNDSLWGHPGVLSFENGVLSSRIMFCDRLFESQAEMKQDILSPSPIDFTGFFEDVFGDG